MNTDDFDPAAPLLSPRAAEPGPGYLEAHPDARVVLAGDRLIVFTPESVGRILTEVFRLFPDRRFAMERFDMIVGIKFIVAVRVDGVLREFELYPLDINYGSISLLLGLVNGD